MNKAVFFLVGICISSLIFFSCTKSTTKSSSNIICMVDFSKSIPPSTLDWYQDVIKNKIMANLGEKDKVIVLPIDYGSQTSSSEIFFVDLQRQSFRKEFDSPLQQDKVAARRLKKYKDSISVIFDSLFNKARIERSKYSQGTDIFGGLSQANKYSIADQNNLAVLFTDMIHETEQLNLNKNLSAEREIETLLKKAPLPNFNHFDVFVMTGEQPKIKIEHYQLLSKFWQAYFSKTNLTLIQYDSGGENILVDKINSYKGINE